MIQLFERIAICSAVLLSSAVFAAPGNTTMGDNVMADGTPGEGKEVYIEARVVPWVEVQNKNGVISVIPPRNGVQVGGDSQAGLLTEKQATEIGDVNGAQKSPNFRLSY